MIKALKEKWVDGECRHICYVCDVAFGCHFHADICKKRNKMLNEIYESGMSNAKDNLGSKQYDKGWHDCYEFYIGITEKYHGGGLSNISQSELDIMTENLARLVDECVERKMGRGLTKYGNVESTEKKMD